MKLKLDQMTPTLAREFNKDPYTIASKLRWAFVKNAFSKISSFPWSSELDIANFILEKDVASLPEPAVAIWHRTTATAWNAEMDLSPAQFEAIAMILKDAGVQSIVHMGDALKADMKNSISQVDKEFTQIFITDYYQKDSFKALFADDGLGTRFSGQILSQLFLSNKIAVTISGHSGAADHLSFIGLPVVMFTTHDAPAHPRMPRLCKECPWWKCVAVGSIEDFKAEIEKEDAYARGSGFSEDGQKALTGAITDAITTWKKPEVLKELHSQARQEVEKMIKKR